mmetsp:Transcript_31354/g.47944  ORF Transcript_31354/g.47944 Transcript_31354/m.47944 type:complete len:140 (+) Transcript_31354:1688-2107(+)
MVESMILAPATDTVETSPCKEITTLDPRSLEMEDPDAQLDEEIKRNREKQEQLQAIESTKAEIVELATKAKPVEEEPVQPVNEEELVDKDGQFIIFEEKEKEELLAKPEGKLEENFSRLGYVNKINILLKALMIERNKN